MMTKIADLDDPGTLFLAAALGGIVGGIFFEKASKVFHALHEKVCHKAVNNGGKEAVKDGEGEPEATGKTGKGHDDMPAGVIFFCSPHCTVKGKEGVADGPN